jgi:uncharacterized membrane protein YraQ (UPF0718 family)
VDTSVIQNLWVLLEAGWLSLLDYLAAHVILCLLPAFFIAGAISALIPKEAITRYLGPTASKWISYPAAALGGFVLAVCSCTILPLFAGIWKRGAGLGPAITFLFVGPAVNILAVAYTGTAIGMDIAIARIILSIIFGIGIGLIMAVMFNDREATADETMFTSQARVRPALWVFFGLMISLLLAGTLKINLLTDTYFSFSILKSLPSVLVNVLQSAHLDIQGALLIIFLVMIGLFASLGFENVLDKFNTSTLVTLGLVVLTLLLAAPSLIEGNGLTIEITGKAIAVGILLLALVIVAKVHLSDEEIAHWLWETWKFIKQIFGLLIVGVFLAGVAKAMIPEAWVETLAGRNTVTANLFGVLFGVFMYFPTLVEVPIARMFLDLGMHRGPLLAYLIADPALSIQSIMVTGQILGKKKTISYVVLVTIFSTMAGYIFGLVLAAIG